MTTAIIILAIILLNPASTTLAYAGNWGLSYTTPGEAPTGNEKAEYLKNFDAYFIDNTGEKTIYLTFDAGYENGYTKDMLNILMKNNVPATFFLVGTYIRNNPDLVNQMVNEGHVVANHTMSHPNMTKIANKETFEKELMQTEDIFKATTGLEMPKYYRPPGGKYSEQHMKMAQELGYKTIFWSLAYADWDDNKQPSKEHAFSKLIPRVHPGAVLLLHNTSKTNLLILEELITRYHEMGYTFKSLDELVNW